MYHVITLPAVVRDPVLLLQLVHQEDVCNPLWDEPDIHGAIVPNLICPQLFQIAVDHDPLVNGVYVAEVSFALKCCHGGAPVQIRPVVR